MNFEQPIKDALSRIELINQNQTMDLTLDFNRLQICDKKNLSTIRKQNPFLVRLTSQMELFSGPHFHIEDLLRSAFALENIQIKFKLSTQSESFRTSKYPDFALFSSYREGQWVVLKQGEPGTAFYTGFGFVSPVQSEEYEKIKLMIDHGEVVSAHLSRYSIQVSKKNPLGFLTWLPVEEIPLEATIARHVQMTALWVVLNHDSNEMLPWGTFGYQLLQWFQNHWSETSKTEWLSLFDLLKTRWLKKEEFLKAWAEKGREYISKLVVQNKNSNESPFFGLESELPGYLQDEEMIQRLGGLLNLEPSFETAKKISETLFYFQLKLKFEFKLLDSIERRLEDVSESNI